MPEKRVEHITTLTFEFQFAFCRVTRTGMSTVKLGCGRGYAHSPFGDEGKVGQARDKDCAGAVRDHTRQDFPCRGRTRVTWGDKNGRALGLALGPINVRRCMNCSFHVRPVEIHRADLYLGKCATESHESSAKTLKLNYDQTMTHGLPRTSHSMGG